jgi:hypothetical protein
MHTRPSVPRPRIARALRLLLTAAALPSLAFAQATADASTRPLPDGNELMAVPNVGQWPPEVCFWARRGAGDLWCERGGLLLAVTPRRAADASGVSEGSGALPSWAPAEGVALRIAFANATGLAAPVAEAAMPQRFSFYLGGDASRWRTQVAATASLRYRDVRPGIDVVVRGEGAGFAYDLHVAPGASPEELVFRCEGTAPLQVADDGSLRMRTALGVVAQRAPRSWHVTADGARVPVASRFELVDAQRYRLRVAHRVVGLPLVVDPGFDWSTYFGGSLDDFGSSLVPIQGLGVIACGVTLSPNYPVTSGTFTAGFDAVLSRLDPEAAGSSQLVWSTFCGGSALDAFFDVADVSDASALEVAIAGMTDSWDFPCSGYAGASDAVVARFDAVGGTRTFCALIGTPGNDRAGAIRPLSAPGEMLIAGFTNSASFPTTPNVVQPTLSGDYDLFLMSLNAGSPPPHAPTWSTFLGGSGREGFIPAMPNIDLDLIDLAVDPAGSSFTVASRSTSTNYPTTPGAMQTFNAGIGDMIISRLGTSGQTLLDSTYFGAGSDDGLNRIAWSPSGDLYIAGFTWSAGFPTTTGAYDRTFAGANDAVLVVLRPQLPPGTALAMHYSTMLGGPGNDPCFAVAVDDAGIAALAGITAGGLSPTTGAAVAQFAPAGMAWVARIDPVGGGVADAHYVSYFGAGGSAFTGILDLRPTVDGRFVATGFTDAAAMATSAGAYQPLVGGGVDMLFARVDLLPAHTSRFGTSTPVCQSTPWVQVNRDPASPSAGFELIVNGLPPNAIGVLGLGAPAPSPTAVLGFALWLQPQLQISGVLLGSVNGSHRVALPIPPGITLGGFGLQYAWCAPSLCATFGATHGLQL